MFRAITLVFILFVAAACSREAKNTAPPASTDAAATDPAAAKPLPEKLPDVLARVNGETITLKEVEDFVRNLEGRAGGPMPAEQRPQVYRGVIDQMVGYKLLLQEAKARKVSVLDAEV